MYLLYVVPEAQPPPSSQAEIYGGYHITLFPAHKIPKDFDLKEVMTSFATTRTRWNLPDDAMVISIEENGLYVVDVVSRTLSNLMDHVQEPNGPFDPERRWEPLHLTLGSNEFEEPVSAEKLYDIFMAEENWYVQLVEKTPLKARPGRNPKNYSWKWLPDQRVPLYRAAPRKH